MAESIHNLERAANASPVHLDLVGQSQQTEALNQRKQQAETQAQNQESPFNVEDKVELQLEPEAIRRLQPNTHLKFLVSDDSNRVIVQIIQSDTNEVLREVPPKSLSEALAALNGGFVKKIR